MGRNSEKNAAVRQVRSKEILDAALTIYTRFGYHATDMDMVAQEAGLAKGLLYYYYKTKKDLFVALYEWVYGEAYALSEKLLAKGQAQNPVERLMHYVHGMFGANQADLRLMQFSMRVPFDAYVIFGADQWKEGAQKSDLHRQALAAIIADGMAQGMMAPMNPSSAANSFWSVFVANAFEYSRLMLGAQGPKNSDQEVFMGVVQFCFQGLGIERDVWHASFEKVTAGQKERDV